MLMIAVQPVVCRLCGVLCLSSDNMRTIACRQVGSLLCTHEPARTAQPRARAICGAHASGSSAAFRGPQDSHRAATGAQSSQFRYEFARITRITLVLFSAMCLFAALFFKYGLTLADLVLAVAVLRNARSLHSMSASGRAHALKLAATGTLAVVCARQGLASWQLEDLWPGYQACRFRVAFALDMMSTRWAMKQWVTHQDAQWLSAATLLAFCQSLFLQR